MSDEQAVTSPALTRWRWQATSRGRTYDLRLDDLHVAADPDRFPYIEGHQLSLQWRDTFFPEELDLISRSERFLPELDFRYELRAHLAGPFWSEQIADDLRVDIGVTRPEVACGDDVRNESVLRVSYQAHGGRFIVTRANAPDPVSVVLPATD